MNASRLTRSSGFTMLEMMISVTLVAVVLGGALMSFERGRALFRQNLANDRINTDTNRALGKITREMYNVGLGTLWPDASTDWGTDTLDFARMETFDAGVPTFGPTTRIVFEFAPGEIENGADDNGDGLVDEGRAVRITNPGTGAEQRSVLVNGLAPYQPGETANGLDDNGNDIRDERGLSFHLDGRQLTVRVCLQRVGPDGRLIVRALQTSLTLRN